MASATEDERFWIAFLRGICGCWDMRPLLPLQAQGETIENEGLRREPTDAFTADDGLQRPLISTWSRGKTQGTSRNYQGRMYVTLLVELDLRR